MQSIRDIYRGGGRRFVTGSHRRRRTAFLAVVAATSVAFSGIALVSAPEAQAVTATCPASANRVVSVTSLNLRQGPSTKYRVIGKLSKGQVVRTSGAKSGQWCKVSAAAKKGWVYGPYLQAPKRSLPGSYIRAHYRNGYLPGDILAAVPWKKDQKLAVKANNDLARLNVAYRARFHENLPVDLGYRTYAMQVKMRKLYGTWAAVPGRSNHGYGLAIDLPDHRYAGSRSYQYRSIANQWNYGTTKYTWMVKNGPKYGWVAPSWALKGHSGPHEPWHFEYVR